MPNGHNPDWVKDALSDVPDEPLPWESAHRVFIAQFLDHYTLHDAGWVGFALVPDCTGIAAVRLDHIWCKDILPLDRSPLLFIRFDPLYHVSLSGRMYGDTINAAQSSTVSETDRKRFLEYLDLICTAPNSGEFVLDDTLCHTTLDDIYDGQIDIYHGQTVNILCLSEKRELIPLPGLPSPDTG